MRPPPDNSPVVLAALRSPIGTAGRSLRDRSAADLAAPVLAALEKTRDTRAELRDVILGNCMGPGGNVARVAALSAGLPPHVPAVTLDRQCASGLAAIAAAASELRAEPGVILAGGVESASTAPWRYWPPLPGADPQRYERAPFSPASIGDPDMGLAADLLAEQHSISRQRQDDYAARSHELAVRAQDSGGYDSEIVPVDGVSRDDRPRSRLTRKRLSRLPPAFRSEGTVTAGNSCGINDGAAVVAMADSATHAHLGGPGLRVVSSAVAGIDPRLPGLGIVPATTRALERAGLSMSEIDVIEFNEAFAGQVLACCDALSLDPDRVCTEGGALALGHPWGASGSVLVVRLFSQLVVQARGRYGLAAIAAGGGQGVAVVFERCL